MLRNQLLALNLVNKRKDSSLQLAFTVQTAPQGDQTAEKEKALSLYTFQLNNSKE